MTKTSSEFFNRKIFELLDRTRTLESKYRLLDPALMAQGAEYISYGPHASSHCIRKRPLNVISVISEDTRQTIRSVPSSIRRNQTILFLSLKVRQRNLLTPAQKILGSTSNPRILYNCALLMVRAGTFALNVSAVQRESWDSISYPILMQPMTLIGALRRT